MFVAVISAFSYVIMVPSAYTSSNKIFVIATPSGRSEERTCLGTSRRRGMLIDVEELWVAS